MFSADSSPYLLFSFLFIPKSCLGLAVLQEFHPVAKKILWWQNARQALILLAPGEMYVYCIST